VLTKLAEIDLRKPLQPIYVDARYGQLSVVVCWGYLPLGTMHFQCHSASRTISVEQLQSEALQTVGWQIWKQAVAGTLDKLNENTEQSWPPISVVVCTRDRPLSLERCLQALAQLDYPAYEVVVIDNCSRDATVAQVVARSGFRCVREDTPGLDWARNRGVEEAEHDIVAFIDDDALAAPGWLRGVAQGFEDPEIMAVTGMALPAEIETPAQGNFERYGGMSKGFVGQTIRRDELNDQALFWASRWGVGTNIAFRRTLFEAIGGFDVALDVGTPTGGAGDIEFFYRTVAAGHILRYEPAAMVRHVHRRESASLQRQIYNNGRSFTAYLLTVARDHPRRRAAILRFALRRWVWGWLLRRLISSLIKRDRWTFRFALTELWGSCSAPWAYRKSQNVALQQLKARHSID
jgi:glycosyltransferase involved in cell wall biosynthesis